MGQETRLTKQVGSFSMNATTRKNRGNETTEGVWEVSSVTVLIFYHQCGEGRNIECSVNRDGSSIIMFCLTHM